MVLFTDLGVKWKEDTPVDDKIRRLIKLGYRQVAINNAVLPPPTGKTKGKGENQKKQLKDPRDILLPEHKLRLHSNVQLIDTGSKLKQLSRLTLIFSKAEQVHNLHSADIQAYDILAVQPSDKDLFHAYERGIHFEIQYGPLIRDQEARKNIITNVQTLIEVGKGKPLDLRGPYDVRVLGLMLGLSELKVRAALTTNCQSVLSHAAARKSGRSMVSVMKLDDVEEKNAWIAKATDTDLLDEGSSAEDSSSSDNSDDDDDDDDSDDEGNTKRAPKDVCSPKRKKRKL
ncbi:P subunit p30-like [Octopus vulgaris]|uniref:P subunit p30-like n=1 Tax=Octopus vulgaris TaxID=6645 RepID=A0AA36BEC5_OCTVU|nr:P subunit p30-like [Octopus vulgaris]